MPAAPAAPTLRGRGQTANRGQPNWQLAEVKIINAGPTRYPPGNRSKAVDRRAKALAGEYRRDLAAMAQWLDRPGLWRGGLRNLLGTLGCRD